MSRTVLCIGVSLFASAAMADYELYNKDDTKIDLQLMVIGAQFGQDQSWFGESHSFLECECEPTGPSSAPSSA